MRMFAKFWPADRAGNKVDQCLIMSKRLKSFSEARPFGFGPNKPSGTESMTEQRIAKIQIQRMGICQDKVMRIL